MTFNPTYKRFGERAILIEWPAIIDEAILKDIISFKATIERNNIKEIIEIKLAYNSLLIIYNSICIKYENCVKKLKSYYFLEDFKHDIVSNTWKIPVCYDTLFGIDLDAISKEKKLSKEVIIKKHSQAIYTVFFIGFLPGFLYLGGLDNSLEIPRKSNPRLQIKKGSVAIGGSQTGVYPNESPGGWNIIGNTPLEFFNPKINPPCFAKAGDKIKFKPITLNEYNDIKVLVDAGVYQLECEKLNG